VPHDIPDPALVVLVGAAGSGKSTWAAAHYRSAEIVSSDALRAIVGSGTGDLDASTDAFAVLDLIVAARLRRGLTTVIDTLGFDRDRRLAYLALGRAAGSPCVAVHFTTPHAVCRARNAKRDRRVPASVLSKQVKRSAALAAELAVEGWDRVQSIDATLAADGGPPTPTPPVAARAATSTSWPPLPGQGIDYILNISRFPWGADPTGWLRDMALAAADVGFAGIALMDHLIQIPQVDRAWEPIPEPYVTLGHLAALGTDLRLGTLVSPVTFRQPGVLAKSLATLDVLTAGRAFAGIGAGWWEREHAAYGLPFPQPRERLDEVERAIETMRALWATGTKPYAGRRVSLPETTCYPRPIGRLPIILGGNGSRTLRIAARHADAVNLPSDEATLSAKLAELHTACAAAERDPATLAMTVLDVSVTGEDREDVARRVERLRGRTSAAAYVRRHHAGTVDEQRRRRDRLADLGVGTIFLALPDLAGASDLDRLRPLLTP